MNNQNFEEYIILSHIEKTIISKYTIEEYNKDQK